MFGLSAVQAGIAAGLLVAGGTVAGVILATSGPLSGDGTPAAVVASPSPTTTATSSATATPSPPGTPGPATTSTATTVSPSTYAPDRVFQPGEAVDWDRLPAVDTSTWKNVTGPNGTLSVRVPPDWETVLTPGGFDGKTGDAITAFGKAGGAQTVKIDIATAPFVVPLEPSEPPARTDMVDVGSARWSDHLLGFQWYAAPEDTGSISVAAHQSTASPRGLYVSGAVGLGLPATASEIATALAVMRSVKVQ